MSQTLSPSSNDPDMPALLATAVGDLTLRFAAAVSRDFAENLGAQVMLLRFLLANLRHKLELAENAAVDYGNHGMANPLGFPIKGE